MNEIRDNIRPCITANAGQALLTPATRTVRLFRNDANQAVRIPAAHPGRAWQLGHQRGVFGRWHAHRVQLR